MTITALDARDEYTASASQTIFNYTFKIYASSELDVYITPSGQTASDSADLTTAYTVDPSTIGDPSGGFITLNAGTSAGDLVTIVSGMPYNRTVDYQNSGDFLPDTVDGDNDRQVSQIKQVADLAKRSLLFPQSLQNASSLDLPLPSSGLYLRWKPDLTGLENTGAPGVTTPSQSFGVVVDMIADTSLSIGDFVVTTGYTTAGDGGGANYLIAASQAVDGYGDHALAGGAVALLQTGVSVEVKQFGATGDGVTDDTAAIQAALDHASTIGAGRVLLSGGTEGFLISSLSIPAYTSLVGDYEYVDPRGGALIYNYKSRLRQTGTILMNESSSVTHCMIVKHGITIPADAAAVATWTGTAITTAASTHGHYVGYCSINGFEYALTTEASTNTEQFRAEHVNFDCLNGIRVENCFDIAYIENCHGWPSLSVNLVGKVDADLRRSGHAFSCLDGGDWNKITNCFSYGYAKGFVISNCNSVTLISCSADYTATLDAATPVGFTIASTSAEARLIGCQAAGQDTGYVIDTSAPNNHVSLTACNAWACDSHGLLNSNGQVFIYNSRFRDCVNGVTPNVSSMTEIHGCSFEGSTGTAIHSQSTSYQVRYSSCTFTNCTGTVGNPYIPTVASSDPLTLNGADTYYLVTGTTSFGSITPTADYTGKIVTLRFADVLTVGDGGGSLYLNGNFVTSADDTLTLLSNGTAWYELSRSAN